MALVPWHHRDTPLLAPGTRLLAPEQPARGENGPDDFDDAI